VDEVTRYLLPTLGLSFRKSKTLLGSVGELNGKQTKTQRRKI
jgi:hypothetical protein